MKTHAYKYTSKPVKHKGYFPMSYSLLLIKNQYG